MLILAADTSGKNGSIALLRFDSSAPQGLKPPPVSAISGTAESRALPSSEKDNNVLRRDSETLEVLPLEGGTFSAQLVPQISALLTKHALSKSDIDAFAVVSGPGSFTGLRVGLAAIKAFAEILQKPIAAVSLLEVVARAAHIRGEVIAALDAGRGEVFVGKYDIEKHSAREELLTIFELQSSAGDGPIVTPDRKLAEALSAVKVTVIPHLRADAVARLGYEKIRAGQTVTPEALDATYIRRSDAEIMRSNRVLR